MRNRLNKSDNPIGLAFNFIDFLGLIFNMDVHSMIGDGFWYPRIVKFVQCHRPEYTRGV